jgi:hypothetical protein
VLLGIGLQYKRVDNLSGDLNLQVKQILPLFNKIMRKFSTVFNTIYSEEARSALP